MVWVDLLRQPAAPSTGRRRPIFEAASAQGNVGLSTGITSARLPWAGKLTLIGSMYAGRLEIMPLLIFLLDLARRVRGARP